MEGCPLFSFTIRTSEHPIARLGLFYKLKQYASQAHPPFLNYRRNCNQVDEYSLGDLQFHTNVLCYHHHHCVQIITNCVAYSARFVLKLVHNKGMTPHGSISKHQLCKIDPLMPMDKQSRLSGPTLQCVITLPSCYPEGCSKLKYYDG